MLSIRQQLLCYLERSLITMMSRFVQRIINSPQTRYLSAEQVGLEVSNERRGGEGCGSQGGW